MGPLHQLLQAYQERFKGVDKPQFYNAWEPSADPQMQVTPAPEHPAMNDRMMMHPEDVPPPASYFPRLPNERQELSSLARLMNLG